MQPEVHWFGSPGYVAWVHNIIGNLESARNGMLAAGVISQGDLNAGVAELEALKTDPSGSAVFVWNRAMAVRRSAGPSAGMRADQQVRSVRLEPDDR